MRRQGFRRSSGVCGFGPLDPQQLSAGFFAQNADGMAMSNAVLKSTCATPSAAGASRAEVAQISNGHTRKAANRVISAMKRGVPLIWHHGRLRHFAILDGKEVPTRVMTALLWGGIIVPNDDGLFAGASQTFRLAP